MPDIIKLKRSGVAAAVPAALEFGELAINYNVADGKIYYKNSAGTIVAIATGSGGGTTVARTYTVTNSGTGAYLIDGVANPTLTLVRGQTYDLTINAAGHPFHFQTVAPPYSSGNLYTTGVTNSGTASGTIRFVVPYDAPATLYYVCQFHSSMGGTVNIVNANEDSVLRSLFIPPAPTGVTATGGNAQAVVSWTAPSVLAQTPITDYTLQFSTNSGTTWTTYIETTIAIGTQPTNQTAASGNATFAVTATVSPSGTPSYQWQRSDDAGVTFAAVAGATSATLSVTSLVNATDDNDRYRVVVSAVGATAVTSSAATLTVTQVANAPTSLAATAGNAQIALRWTAPSAPGSSAITGYTVEYTPSGGSAQTVSTGSTSNSYTLTGLANGTAYTVRVAGVSAAGTGTYTAASSSVTPVSTTVPGVPTGLSFSSGSCGQGGFSWTAPGSNGGATITGYRQRGSVDSYATFRSVSGTSVADSRGSFAGLSSGNTWTVRISAVNSVGEGPYVALTMADDNNNGFAMNCG